MTLIGSILSGILPNNVQAKGLSPRISLEMSFETYQSQALTPIMQFARRVISGHRETRVEDLRNTLTDEHPVLVTPPAGSQPSNQDDRKVRVLIADDDYPTQRYLRRYIINLARDYSVAFEFEFVESGEQAEQKYQEAIMTGRPFDFAVLDFLMRPGDGLGVAHTIREAEKTQGLNRMVIFLHTGEAFERGFPERRHGLVDELFIKTEYTMMTFQTAVVERLNLEKRDDSRGQGHPSGLSAIALLSVDPFHPHIYSMSAWMLGFGAVASLWLSLTKNQRRILRQGIQRIYSAA